MENVEWVKLAPYLDFTLPHPLDAEREEKTKEIREIYDFFGDMGRFLEHYSRLPISPGFGKTKIEQVKESISLLKLSAKLEEDLKAMGLR